MTQANIHIRTPHEDILAAVNKDFLEGKILAKELSTRELCAVLVLVSKKEIGSAGEAACAEILHRLQWRPKQAAQAPQAPKPEPVPVVKGVVMGEEDISILTPRADLLHESYEYLVNQRPAQELSARELCAVFVFINEHIGEIGKEMLVRLQNPPIPAPARIGTDNLFVNLVAAAFESQTDPTGPQRDLSWRLERAAFEFAQDYSRRVPK